MLSIFTLVHWRVQTAQGGVRQGPALLHLNELQATEQVVFTLASLVLCKHLWKSCIEHHSFYRLHRLPLELYSAINPSAGQPPTNSPTASGGLLKRCRLTPSPLLSSPPPRAPLLTSCSCACAAHRVLVQWRFGVTGLRVSAAARAPAAPHRIRSQPLRPAFSFDTGLFCSYEYVFIVLLWGDYLGYSHSRTLPLYCTFTQYYKTCTNTT